MSQFVTHRDPRYFPEPLRFDPDRWTAGSREARPQFSYFPFGGGPRRCIGEGFAWMEELFSSRLWPALANAVGAKSSRSAQAGDHAKAKTWNADDCNQEVIGRCRRQVSVAASRVLLPPAPAYCSCSLPSAPVFVISFALSKS